MNKCACWIVIAICETLLAAATIIFLGIDSTWIAIALNEQSQEDTMKLIISIVIAVGQAILLFCSLRCVPPMPGAYIMYHAENKSDTYGAIQADKYPLKKDEQHQQEIAVMNERIKQLEQSKKVKQDELDTLKHNHSILKTEKSSMECIIDNQQENVVCIESKCSDLEKKCLGLENEKIKSAKTTEEYQTKCSNLETKCCDLEYEQITLMETKEKYKTKCMNLESECTELESEKIKYKKKLDKLKEESKQSPDSEDGKESLDIKQLRSEIKGIKKQNNKLEDQLRQTTMGKGIESNFIKEEDFSNKKLSPFRQQTFKNMHDDIVDELCEMYDDLDADSDEEESDESDSKNDFDKVLNEETDTKTRFELLMDRVGYEFLFDLLMLCYSFMLSRKVKICEIVGKQLNISGNKKQSSGEIAAVMIHPQLQQQWEEYLYNEMENVYGINVYDKNKVIDDIFVSICGENKYKNWRFLGNKFEKGMKDYIFKCCEICWIMILTKPELTFYPSSFRMFVEHEENEYFYNEKDKHDLWTGSKTKNGAKIVFFAIPAIVQSHFLHKKQKMHIIKGTLFAHNDEELMKYVMTDPQLLLDQLNQ